MLHGETGGRGRSSSTRVDTDDGHGDVNTVFKEGGEKTGQRRAGEAMLLLLLISFIIISYVVDTVTSYCSV